MIHEANTRKWKLGDVVIHDADAKKREMLMRVTGTTREGLIITRYVDRTVCADRYENKTEVLHDPSRFGLFEGGEPKEKDDPSSAPADMKTRNNPDVTELRETPNGGSQQRIGALGEFTDGRGRTKQCRVTGTRDGGLTLCITYHNSEAGRAIKTAYIAASMFRPSGDVCSTGEAAQRKSERRRT